MDNNWLSTLIKIIFSNFPASMTILALVLGVLHILMTRKGQKANVMLGYLLFLGVGMAGIWGFVMHAFFPELSAQFIGWANSPFQFEVAMANLGMGMAGIFALYPSKGYRVATTVFTTCFLWGAAYGHIVQMITTQNFAPGDAGSIFYNDIILPLLLIIFVSLSKKPLPLKNP